MLANSHSPAARGTQLWCLPAMSVGLVGKLSLQAAELYQATGRPPGAVRRSTSAGWQADAVQSAHTGLHFHTGVHHRSRFSCPGLQVRTMHALDHENVLKFYAW